MERGLSLLIAALVAYVAQDVQGTSHLSFSNNTQVSITRDGCGVSKLCVSAPDNCDPTMSGMCLFASVAASSPMPPNGTKLSFQLRGYSTGYVALGLTMNASEGNTMLFICAQNMTNNGSFFFRTRTRNNANNMLTANERRVKEIRGMVDGNVIKCEFMVPYANASQNGNSGDTTYVLLGGNGTYDPSVLGPFNTLLTTGRLNLSNPAANIPPPTPTTATATTSGAVQPHAVLSLVSVLALFVMLKV